VPFTPIAGIVVSFYMMYSLTTATWIRLVVWLVIGLIIYFTYSRHHSRVQRGLAVEEAVEPPVPAQR
jgi:APA family basic amino acid/polyamine antiporter